MKKALALIFLMAVSVTAQADWKESISTGWQSVKNTSTDLYQTLP